MSFQAEAETLPPLLHRFSELIFFSDFNNVANVDYRNNHNKFDSSVDELTLCTGWKML